MGAEQYEWLKVGDFATRFGFSRHQVYRWVKAGTLPHIRMCPESERCIRIRGDALDQMLAEQRGAS